MRQEERLLRQITRALELMQCEIQSRLTPTKELFALAAGVCSGSLRDIFSAAAQRIAMQEDVDVGKIMDCVLVRHGARLPISCICRLRELGEILGAYEVNEQTQALEALVGRVNGSAEELLRGKAERCRSYEVMGVCAGCALAIILL